MKNAVYLPHISCLSLAENHMEHLILNRFLSEVFKVKSIRSFFQITAALLLLALLVIPTGAAGAENSVILGGCPFGVRLYSDSLSVVGLADVDTADGARCPAGDAGIAKGDLILQINGAQIHSAEEFSKDVEQGSGKEVTLLIRRGDKEFEVKLTPQKSVSDGKYRLGLWLSDSTAGIGTMTFVMPDSLAFGGLGHGIGVVDGNERVGSDRGAVYDVSISSVRRGQSGSPGELQGSFLPDKLGSLVENTSKGVFGVCSELPDELNATQTIEVCPAEKVKPGKATLYCTLGDDGIVGYDVEISDISTDLSASRSFVVTVTDSRLIERTGGIVQGMSGSPLVQDGRLIGAVTHVFISDPTCGYGIFIGNMLECVPSVLR